MRLRVWGVRTELKRKHYSRDDSIANARMLVTMKRVMLAVCVCVLVIVSMLLSSRIAIIVLTTINSILMGL